MNRHRFITAVSLAALLLACDSTSPSPNLDGVWGGRINYPNVIDTLTLALGEQDGQIRGFAIQRRLDDTRVGLMYGVAGSITGRSVELTLQSGSTSMVMRGEIFRSTLVLSNGDQQVTLRLSTSRGDGVAGTWALFSTTGPTLAIRDTIEILPDGRARRHREHQSFSYGTNAIWLRRGDWLVLEQYNFSTIVTIPTRDSLEIQSNNLVRTTRFVDGSTSTEMYARTPSP